MYEKVSAEEMLSAIDNGLHPVWFSVENSTLTVDLCVNYRLTDGKVLFLQFYCTEPQELSRVAHEVARKAKQNWIETLNKMTERLDGQIEEVTEAEKNIASIQWKEKQKYLVSYSDDNKVTYECTCSSDSDIYLKEVLNEKERLYNFGNHEVSVREVVFGDTKVELID